MSEAARLEVIVSAQGISKVRGELAGLNSGAANAAKGLVRATAAAVGLGSAAAAVRAVTTQTVAFDKSMRNVNSIAKLNERQFGRLEKSVLKLSGKTAQAPVTLAEGLYDLVSSGFSAHQSVRVLTASARAATAGLTDTATATKAVAAVLNAYHLRASAAGRVSDDLFQTVNRGVISFEELAQNVGDVLPVAASLNIGLKEVGAATATLTKNGESAPEAMTKIKGAMVALIKPSDDLKKVYEELGVKSGEELIKNTGSLQGALQALERSTGGSQEALAKLFPDLRGLQGAMQLTGKNARAANEDLKAFGSDRGATKSALAEQAKSVSFQFDKLKATLAQAAISLGSKLIPAMATAASSAARFVQQMINGKGAGGEFAAKVAEIADRIAGVARPIMSAAKAVGQFFLDHPKWAGVAVTAWATYKAAALAAAAATRLALVGSFVGIGGKAAAEGATAGRLFGASAAAAAARGMVRFAGWAAIGAEIIDATGIGTAITRALDGPVTKVLGLNKPVTKPPEFDTKGQVRNVENLTRYIRSLSAAYADSSARAQVAQVANGRFGSSADAAGKQALVAAAGTKKFGDAANMLPRSKSTRIRADGVDPAKRAVAELIALIGRLQNKTITITGRYIPPVGLPGRGGNDGGGGIGRTRAANGITLTAAEAFIAAQQQIIEGAQGRSDFLQRRFAREDYNREHGKLSALAGRKLTSTEGLKGDKLQAAKDRNDRIRESRRQLRDLEREHKRQGLLDAQSDAATDAQRRIDRRQARLDGPHKTDYTIALGAAAQAKGDAGLFESASRQLVRDRRREYNQAIKTGDPRKIAEASQNLAAASDQLKSAAQAIKDAAETARDTNIGAHDAAFIAAQIATPDDKTDDRAALVSKAGDVKGYYDTALLTGDIAGQQKWGAMFLSLTDSIKSLDEAVQENTATNQEEVELLKAQVLDAQRTANLAHAQGRQILDWISGGLGQRVLSASTTPAAGRRGSL